MDKELIEKVKSYLKHVRESPVMYKFPDYSLKEKGHWCVLGGTNTYNGRRELTAVVYGRFVDAVAYAVQRPEFYNPRWLEEKGESELDLADCGYIIKVQPQKLKAVKGLEDLIG